DVEDLRHHARPAVEWHHADVDVDPAAGDEAVAFPLELILPARLQRRRPAAPDVGVARHRRHRMHGSRQPPAQQRERDRTHPHPPHHRLAYHTLGKESRRTACVRFTDVIEPVVMQRTGVGAPKRFILELLKPSHYDDDGYVIQWWRGSIPSNT